MTTFDILLFKEVYHLFKKEINRVIKICGKEDYSYRFIDTWYYDENINMVEGEGEEYLRFGEYEKHHVSFPIEYLIYTDEQLQKIVDAKIRENQIKKEEERKERERKQIIAEREEYERLKLKFEN